MTHIDRALMFSSLLTLAACGEIGDVPTPTPAPTLSIRAPQGGLATAAPAKVSLFFTVETSSGMPVPLLNADAFQISEDGSAISPLESQQTVQPRGQAYRMDSLLLLDMSGSILRGGNAPTLRQAAGHYIDEVLSQPEGQQIALMTFDGRAQPQLVAGFTSDAATLQHALDSLLTTECQVQADCAVYADRRTCAAFRCVDDSTNLYGAVIAGVTTLESRLKAPDGIQFKDAVLVAFTDGQDQAARVSEATALERVSVTPVKVLTVGLGSDVDHDALNRIGKDGSFSAAQPAELEAAFSQAAAQVKGQANKSYVLEYCSPRRGGQHQLDLAVTASMPMGPIQGALTESFDATGFTSGCSL